MKPRLKLSTSGKISLLTPGKVEWKEYAARRFIRSHYGSLQAFAIRFALPYAAVCNAVDNPRFERTAGPVATVRQLLGLPSNPTPASIALSRAQAQRRSRG